MTLHVDVFSAMHNEEFLLPYFLRHYETVADRIVIWDDASTDRTAEIAAAHPLVTLLPLKNPTAGVNNPWMCDVWKQAYRTMSRGIATWVIVVDADEFIVGRAPRVPTGVRDLLAAARAQGFQLLQPVGYQMVSEVVPTTSGQIYDDVCEGFPAGLFDKPCIVDPALDVTFGLGQHAIYAGEQVWGPSVLASVWGASPQHETVQKRRPSGGLRLLHMSHLSVDHYCAWSDHAMPRRLDYSDKKRARHRRDGLALFTKPRQRIL